MDIVQFSPAPPSVFKEISFHRFLTLRNQRNQAKTRKTKKPRNSETYVPFSGNPLREGDAETPETPETRDGNYVIIIFNTMVILPLANAGFI